MPTSATERATHAGPAAVPRRIAFLVWRDTRHPEGGGSEVYVERMATWLAARGHDVTIVCAAHENAPADEVRDGVRFRRRGGWLTVYVRAFMWLASRGGRHTDVVVDVQNGLPFLSPLLRRRGRHILVHHVHREQWQIIYPGAKGRFGWWVESWLSPRLYRGVPYVTVSESTRNELGELGVRPDRIAIIHNGIAVPHPLDLGPRSATPRLCTVGRLVPHKQIEHALHVVSVLRHEVADLHLDIVGDGWWLGPLRECAAALGVTDVVTFHGYLDDAARDAVVDSSWLMLAPSVKEGWGISIMEAAARGVPALAYRTAGGVTESIVDGETGVLADHLDDMVAKVRNLLDDDEGRQIMAKKARDRASSFCWDVSAEAFEKRLLGES
jgi:glycosyltransferase involved in cell wall biosynthesis